MVDYCSAIGVAHVVVQHTLHEKRVGAESWDIYTVWPEILAGRYFGGLLKICHLAEFTLAVEPGSVIMIFIAKWLIERAGNLTGP